jgi:acyl transferase domain-containing protein
VGRPETDAPGAAVAIVGMACRVPGADSPEELWKRISNGEVLVERLDEKALSEAGVPRHIYSNASYVPAFASMSGISLFDEGFFGMSSHEAEILDPQHRIFLEGAWHALEAAGHRSDDDAVLAGVFAGMGAANYHSGTKQLAADDDPAASFERLISSDKDFLTTRVAYKLNLKGPAITVQTGCSSSLVAVHLACQSLLLGECDIAFAGGVSISSFQRKGYTFQEGMVLSRDGHCRPFDRSATGTVPSSGMGVVALKRLEDAIHDGNHIHAVILGSAVNNDGASKAGQ